MKTCDHCGSTNPDAAKFCLDCGRALTDVPISSPHSTIESSLPPTLPPQPRIPPTVAAESSPIPPTVAAESSPIPPTVAAESSPIPPTEVKSYTIDPQKLQSLYQSVVSKQRKADIMFVLDCTGSMQGEIDAIRDAITHFADSITAESVRARVGLVEFRDRLFKEEHRVITFNGQIFTSDPMLFREQIAGLRAKGGGDEPESSLDAMMLALKQPFDPEANKVIVLITDAPPHIPDLQTRSMEEVMSRLREVAIDQVYLVMRTQDPNSQVYLKLLEGTRGLAFEIGKGDDFRSRAEDFKRTLMALGKTISTMTR